MKKILIIEARFYEEIADKMVSSAVLEIEQGGFTFETVQVPGAFEIPAAVSMGIKSGKYDGYVALGCVIRGETTHYDYVCGESARGLNELAIDRNAAIGYGIITAENREQANVRADRAQKDVGGRAAKACIAMLDLKEKMNIN